MTEEQQFKTKALSAGMDNLNAEYRNRKDRETDSYHQAIFQLLLNVDETWRAKNEKSWFETALDNIGGHKVVEQWKPEKGERYWYVTIDCGVIFSTWKNDAVDKSLSIANNCFRSEQDAIAAQERIKKALLG
jgi:hypothetical protein